MKNRINKDLKFKKKQLVLKPWKQRKPKIIHVGLQRKFTFFLWVIMLASICFGTYKNFTSIDMHTIKEKEIVELKLVDTTKIQSFVKNFVMIYYSWQRTPEALDERTRLLEHYLTRELQQLNNEIIRSDIPTTSDATNIQFWSIEKIEKNVYGIIFSVDQHISENKKIKTITSTYKLSIYVEDNGNMVIIKNPTVTSKPVKSNYQPKSLEMDDAVNSKTREEVTKFLETFFKLYPKASQKELDYYSSTNVLKAINKEYVFVEILNPIYRKDEEKVKATLSVKYINEQTKAIQISQFELILEKEKEWFIYDV